MLRDMAQSNEVKDGNPVRAQANAQKRDPDPSARWQTLLRDAVAQKAEASSKLRPAQQNELMMLKIRL